MHAAELASRLGIPRIIVPKNAGILSALGMLLSDAIKDYSRTVLLKSRDYSFQDLEGLMQPLVERGLGEMKLEGFREEKLSLLPSLDLRYVGQSYELTVPFNSHFLSIFHQVHQQRYGYCKEEKEVEIVNLRLKAVGKRRKPSLLPSQRINQGSPAIYEKREMIFKGKSYEGLIYLRKDLQTGHCIEGPALIIDFGSTTVLPPEVSCRVDPYQSLIIERNINLP